MKNLITAIILSFTAMLANAQYQVQASSPAPASSYTGVDEAKEIVSDIMSAVGLKPNYELYPANIPNAAAVNYNGKRYVMYNPAFFSKLNAAAGNKWASVSVLAHEIGHHLNGHTLKNNGSEPSQELEADEFSGFVLRRMGATLEQSQAAMKLAADYRPSLTHPGQEARLTAIASGWNNANGQGNGKDIAKYSKPVAAPAPAVMQPVYRNEEGNSMATNVSNVNTILNDRYILADVNFPSDRTASYYVTTRYNLVKLQDGRLYLVGKLLKTTSNDYPYVLADNADTKMLVDKYGKITQVIMPLFNFFSGHRVY